MSRITAILGVLVAAGVALLLLLDGRGALDVGPSGSLPEDCADARESVRLEGRRSEPAPEEGRPPRIEGDIRARGTVLGTSGRRVQGGHVAAWPDGRREEPVRLAVQRALFDGLLPRTLAGPIVLAFQDGERLASRPYRATVAAGGTLGPVRLLAEEMALLEITVEAPTGRSPAGAAVAVEGTSPDRIEIFADVEGRVSVRVPPGALVLEARSADAVHRGWARVEAAAGQTRAVTIQLEDPWEPILVRVVSMHGAVLTGREATVYIDRGDAQTSVQAIVGGPPVEVLVPPPSRASPGISFGAALGSGRPRRWVTTTHSRELLERGRKEPWVVRVYAE